MNEEVRQITEAAKSGPFFFDWLTYLWVCVVAGWGGLVRYLNSMRDRKETGKEAALTLVIGIITSTFVGVITFWLCELAALDKLTTAICVAITGHMGAEVLRVFQRLAVSRLKAAWAALVAPTENTP